MKRAMTKLILRGPCPLPRRPSAFGCERPQPAADREAHRRVGPKRQSQLHGRFGRDLRDRVDPVSTPGKPASFLATGSLQLRLVDREAHVPSPRRSSLDQNEASKHPLGRSGDPRASICRTHAGCPSNAIAAAGLARASRPYLRFTDITRRSGGRRHGYWPPTASDLATLGLTQHCMRMAATLDPY